MAAAVAIDGDTIRLGQEIIRLAYVDAPELHGKCDAERYLALLAKDFTARFISSGEVLVTRHGKEKYGRTLAAISVNDADLGQALVSARLAVIWEGRRHNWCGLRAK